MIFEHQSKNKKVLLAVSIIILLGGILVFAWPKFFGEANERKEVQNLVETFGKRLQNVSLLASQDALRRSLEDNYGHLVSSPQVMIAQWVAEALDDPTKVPGRLTSSPWPDRIEILSVNKISEYVYEVKGEVIEITSKETTSDPTKRSITILVEKRRDLGNRFVISGVTLGSYENAQTTSGFNNDKIEKAITDYLLTERHFSWKNRTDSFNFCAVENLDPEKELFPLYVWAYCGEYIVEDGELKTVSGSSGPVKIDYPNELSFYDPRNFSYESPGDGSQYIEDIRKIFPENVQQKILDFNRGPIIKKTEEFVLANILSWESIKQAINDCEVKKVFQTHSRDVSVTLKNGNKLIAIEPHIDAVITITEATKLKCGRVPIGTE